MNINYVLFYFLIVYNKMDFQFNLFMIIFFSVYNILYLEVYCLVVKLILVVILDNGKFILDYGEVFFGQNIIKFVIIQNIFNKIVEVNVFFCNKICINI